MITSAEINALVAMQGSQQGMMLGGGLPMGMPSPMMGPSQYPAQFQQPQGFNFGMRNATNWGAMGANAAMAPIGAIGPGLGMASMGAGLAQAGAGVAQWAGIGGPRIAAMAGSRALGMVSNLDPTTAFLGGAIQGGMAGWGGGVGGVMGGAVGGGFAAMMNPVTLGAGAAAFAATQAWRGFRDQQQVNGIMGGFQFANAESYTGRGFSARQMQSMGTAMRTMDAADPFTSMQDLTGMMRRFNEFGMSQGVRDSEEFSKRFKSMVDTVKTMARTLGTTMDDASQVFGQMRQAGFYSPKDVLGNTQRMRFAEGMGISRDQYLSTQQMGAANARMMGMTGAAGGTAAGRAQETYMLGTSLGILGKDELADISGTGDAAAGAQMLGLNASNAVSRWLTGSGAGQALLAATGEADASGKFTGGLNRGMSRRLREGTLSMDEAKNAGMRNMRGKDAGLSFTTRNKDITAALMKEEDFASIAGMVVQGIAGDKFADRSQDDMTEWLVEQQLGMSHKEAQAYVKIAREGARVRSDRNRKLMQEIQAQAVEQDQKMNRSVGGLAQKMTGGWSDLFTGVKDWGAGTGTDFETFTQRMGDRFWGVSRVTTTEQGARAGVAGLVRGEIPQQAGGVSLVQQQAARGDMSGLKALFTADERAFLDKASTGGALKAYAAKGVRRGSDVESLDKAGVVVQTMLTNYQGGFDKWTSWSPEKRRAATAILASKEGASGLARMGGAAVGTGTYGSLREMQGVLGEELHGLQQNWAGFREAQLHPFQGNQDIVQGGEMQDVLAAMAGQGDPSKLLAGIQDSASEENLAPGEAESWVAEKLGKQLGTSVSVGTLRRIQGLDQGNLSKFAGLAKRARVGNAGLNTMGNLRAAMSGSSLGGKEFDTLQRALGGTGDVSAAMDAWIASTKGMSQDELEKSAFGAASLDAGRVLTQSAKWDAKKLASEGYSKELLDSLGVNAADGISSEESRKLARSSLYGAASGGGGMWTSNVEENMRRAAKALESMSNDGILIRAPGAPGKTTADTQGNGAANEGTSPYPWMHK